MIMGGNGDRDLNQVIAYPVCDAVNVILILLHKLYNFCIILGKHVECTADIRLCQRKHYQKNIITASERHGRCADEHRI